MGPHQQANRERGRPAYPAKGRGELMDLRLPLGITLWQLSSCFAVAAGRALSRAASPRASQEDKEMVRAQAMPQWGVEHGAASVRSAPASAPAWAWKKKLSFFLGLLSVREFCQTFLLALFVLPVAGTFVRASTFSYCVSAECSTARFRSQM